MQGNGSTAPSVQRYDTPKIAQRQHDWSNHEEAVEHCNTAGRSVSAEIRYTVTAPSNRASATPCDKGVSSKVIQSLYNTLHIEHEWKSKFTPYYMFHETQKTTGMLKHRPY